MRCKKSIVFFLSVVCEELTSTYVLKIINYEIRSSLLLTVFMCLLTSKLHVFESCCQVPSFRNEVPRFRSNVHFAFCFFFLVKNKKTQRRERKKEENSSVFFILLLPSFFFFFILLVIFFPFASPHVFVLACWFILTLFMFCHHSCSIARA